MTKHVVTFGEVLMRLSVPDFGRFSQAKSYNVVYGGAEANVGISLAHFGVPATHVTRLPHNAIGKAVVQYLKSNDVDTSKITFGTQRLGLYFLENGAMQRAPKIIYDRFDSAFSHIAPGEINWNVIMEQASWFHWTGITPAISQGAAAVCLEAVTAARKYNVPVSGDINYRRNLWQYGKTAIDVMPELIRGSQYIVAGLSDLENCAGIKSDNFLNACSQMLKSFPQLKAIANVHRETISASHNKIKGILWDTMNLLTSREYDLTHIVDRVGAGDAFMAGLIYGWLYRYSDQQALDYATAATALKHSIEGDANLATVEEVQALVDDQNTGKLLR